MLLVQNMDKKKTLYEKNIYLSYLSMKNFTYNKLTNLHFLTFKKKVYGCFVESNFDLVV